MKKIVSLLARILVFPLALIAGFGRFHEGFVFGAQLLALFPGLIGSYLRVAYYKQTLEHVGTDCHIAVGSSFAHSQSSIGNRVGIGSYCVLGQVTLGDGTLVASSAQVLSGSRQHSRDERGYLTDVGRTFVRVTVGKECWIGAGVVVMANLGDMVTVSPGSVVSNNVPDGAVVAGNPARPIRVITPTVSPGSLVSNNVPDGAVVAGDPVRPMRVITPTVSCASPEVGLNAFTRLQYLIGGVLKVPPQTVRREVLLVDSGWDSLSLLILREECEKAFGISIPDIAWLKTNSVSDLVALIERLSGPTSSGVAVQSRAPEDFQQWNSDDMAEVLEIGMPLLGIGNLCESALLKHLGDMRWRHIMRLTGTPSRNLIDDQGNRLYPAFFYVKVRFPESRPMGSFGENDTFLLMDTVKRYGQSMLDGTAYLIPSERRQTVSKPLTSLEEAVEQGIPAVQMSNAFVMKFDGAEWLKRSRPKKGILDSVVEMPSPPDSYELSRVAQQGRGVGTPSEGSRALHDDDVCYQYAIQPDRDVNGVGLIYFANYPLFLDLAERHALKQADSLWSDAAISTRSLLARNIVYLNNAAWHDSMTIRTRSWVRLLPDREADFHLASEQRMHRKSDGRLMCVCWSEKIVTDTSNRLTDWIRSPG